MQYKVTIPGSHDLAQERPCVILVECVSDRAAKDECVHDPETTAPDGTGGVEVPAQHDAGLHPENEMWGAGFHVPVGAISNTDKRGERVH